MDDRCLFRLATTEAGLDVGYLISSYGVNAPDTYLYQPYSERIDTQRGAVALRGFGIIPWVFNNILTEHARILEDLVNTVNATKSRIYLTSNASTANAPGVFYDFTAVPSIGQKNPQIGSDVMDTFTILFNDVIVENSPSTVYG